MYNQRRSSSVYSRTVSQWFDDDSSWRSADLRDDPMPEMPPLPILQPVAYSKSTPHLIERPSAPPPFLEPRAFNPLIVTPSPTASRVTTPNRSPLPSPGPTPSYHQERELQQSPPPTYPTSPPIHHTPNKSVHTISLEQAKAALHSPGAVHLLPEEMRAQTRKSRSHEMIRPLVRVSTSKFFDMATPPQGAVPPMPPTLIDHQGRHRSLHTGMEYPFPSGYASPIQPPRIVERPPLEMQPREASKVKAAEALGLDADDEPRGRTREQGPRSMDYSHYMPKGRRPGSSPSPEDEERNDAQKVASEYHHLLSEQYRQPSLSPAYNSDDSIRAHMKMVPQPLFKNKPAAKLPGSVSEYGSGRGSNASESPFHLRADSVASKASSGTQGSLPMQLSLTPEPIYRRTSTTGSIPISPPTNSAHASPAPVRRPARSAERPKKERSRRRSEDWRVSMYYPYVGSRKGKKAKEKKGERPAPPLPLLAAEAIAHRLRTPDASANSSPLRTIAPINFNDNSSNRRKGSNASPDAERRPLIQRLAGNAMKYADLVTRPSAAPEPSNPTTASAHSPHLLPSPVKSSPPPVHLGWSDTAKTTFDRMQSPPSTPHSTHFTNLPARPLHERYTDSTETTNRGRTGSGGIFGGLLDGWKERRKEEKREELKKIIRVVPQLPPARMATIDIVGAPAPPAGAPGLVRQQSVGTGTEQARPVSGLARRMSALGWM